MGRVFTGKTNVGISFIEIFVKIYFEFLSLDK